MSKNKTHRREVVAFLNDPVLICLVDGHKPDLALFPVNHQLFAERFAVQQKDPDAARFNAASALYEHRASVRDVRRHAGS